VADYGKTVRRTIAIHAHKTGVCQLVASQVMLGFLLGLQKAGLRD
jgi:hypothetical protein